MTMFHVKLHKVEGRVIVTIVDPELIGKIFEDNGCQLDLSSNFYKGQAREEKEIDKFLTISNIVNAAGERAIDYLKRKGLVTDKEVLRVQDVPHVQIVLEDES